MIYPIRAGLSACPAAPPSRPTGRMLARSCAATVFSAAQGDNARETRRGITERPDLAEFPRLADLLVAAAAARRDCRPFPSRGFRAHCRRPGHGFGDGRCGGCADAAGRTADAADP